MKSPTGTSVDIPTETTAPQTEYENGLLEERLAKWREEQFRVADQVVVLEDDPVDEPPSSSRFRVKESNQYTDKLFGGVDVSFPEKEGDPAVAVYCVVRQNKVVYHDYETFDLTVPYVSSYLSFREIDPLERLVKKQMEQNPDLTPYCILVDGNGVLHERRAGIACFLGVRTGLKTIGVGKTLYCHAGLSTTLVKNGIDYAVEELARQTRNDKEFNRRLKDGNRGIVWDSLCIDASYPNQEERETDDDVSRMDRGGLIQELGPLCCGVGIKLKGSDGRVWAGALLGHGGHVGNKQLKGCGTKNPIFVSVGHLVSLEEAVGICAELSQARIPEPVRQADLSGRQLLREASRTKTP